MLSELPNLVCSFLTIIESDCVWYIVFSGTDCFCKNICYKRWCMEIFLRRKRCLRLCYIWGSRNPKYAVLCKILRNVRILRNTAVHRKIRPYFCKIRPSFVKYWCILPYLAKTRSKSSYFTKNSLILGPNQSSHSTTLPVAWASVARPADAICAVFDCTTTFKGPSDFTSKVMAQRAQTITVSPRNMNS